MSDFDKLEDVMGCKVTKTLMKTSFQAKKSVEIGVLPKYGACPYG
jgi:hypothetical protein